MSVFAKEITTRDAECLRPDKLEPVRGDDLLLIAADLEERRLLFAELLEAGYKALSLPGAMHALVWLRSARAAPPLIVLDVFGDEQATPAFVESLRQLCAGSQLCWLSARSSGSNGSRCAAT